MTETTVNVDFVIRTKKAVYTVAEARLELANLETALSEIEWRQELIDKAQVKPELVK